MNKEIWMPTVDTAQVLADHVKLCAEQKAEIERLRELVETAYFEGFKSGDGGPFTREFSWEHSDIRAALQPK